MRSAVFCPAFPKFTSLIPTTPIFSPAVSGRYLSAMRALAQASARAAKEPLIGIGLGSVENKFSGAFPGADILMFRLEVMQRIGSRDALAMMTPWEISAVAKDVVEKTRVDAIMFPGSRNAIAELFWKPGEALPQETPKTLADVTQNEVLTAYCIFKMAMTIEALKRGIPSIYSCDATNYPVVAMGGEVVRVPTKAGSVVHNNGYDHSVTIPSGSWLHKMSKKITSKKEKNGDIIIPDVCSTHPLLPKRVPASFAVLATAPDGSPSIFTVTPYVLGLVDHFEVTSPRLVRQSEMSTYTRDEDDAPNFESTKLWEKLAKAFVKAAAMPNNLHPVDEKLFSPRIQEIMAVKDWTEYSKTTFDLGQRSFAGRPNADAEPKNPESKGWVDSTGATLDASQSR